MKYLSFNIDNINAGKILFDFYEKTGDGRYKMAMDTLRKQLAEQPRTSEGGFWHKLVYPHQMWLDGIFMASPYLAQYGNVFKDTTVNADIVNQIKLIARKRMILKPVCSIMAGMRARHKIGQIRKPGAHPTSGAAV